MTELRTSEPPLKKLLERIRQLVSPHKRRIKRISRDRVLRQRIKTEPLKIVIGASGVFEPGWIATDAYQLNLLDEARWRHFFDYDSILALLAEHVWEHLSVELGKAAAALCYRFLRKDGYIRVAVPDGFFPDAAYQEWIKVGGIGGGGREGGHLVVYTYRSLVHLFESAGFSVSLLEYHDESGTLHVNAWRPEDGMIHRSSRFDERGAVSVVIDARKA